MRQLSEESAIKLQRILARRLGRELTQEELEQAYDALMEFAFALLDMVEPDQQNKYRLTTPRPFFITLTIVNRYCIVIYC
ncbi:hypothetical protein A3F62_04870 [Candidatus Woesebacteria bacterium RIFCSPHIGHO2_12_FULL_44_11]|nr:MAG: hypothetical protein A3F62_04870 [Candidatus Woesebacteria bacterium RIFCSPHIGHO2_12_FULL_44_11]